jgi:DNA repair exonuclease SbcCD ATPase subunit
MDIRHLNASTEEARRFVAKAELAKALDACTNALAAAEKREATLREVAQKVELLIHFTQEYCGDEMLPNLEGWSHYDARMMLLEVLAATAAPVTSNDRTCPACGKVLEPLEEVDG